MTYKITMSLRPVHLLHLSIDSTTNFMVAYHLSYEGNFVTSYKYAPYVDELYHAVQGPHG